MGEPKILNVVYKFIDGAHIFSSTDPLIQGLYAASTELKEAFDDVPIQAKTLLQLNHKIDVDVVPQIPYEEFLKQILGPITKALAISHFFSDRRNARSTIWHAISSARTG